MREYLVLDSNGNAQMIYHTTALDHSKVICLFSSQGNAMPYRMLHQT